MSECPSFPTEGKRLEHPIDSIVVDDVVEMRVETVDVLANPIVVCVNSMSSCKEPNVALPNTIEISLHTFARRDATRRHAS